MTHGALEQKAGIGDLAMNGPPPEVATRILSPRGSVKGGAVVLAMRYQGKRL